MCQLNSSVLVLFVQGDYGQTRVTIIQYDYEPDATPTTGPAASNSTSVQANTANVQQSLSSVAAETASKGESLIGKGYLH